MKDSHDRYANIEVSYLLQRMDAYRGLAILTTNREDDLDSAFLRRLRFIVRFPFPGSAPRAEIWKRAFPAAVPMGDVEMAKSAVVAVGTCPDMRRLGFRGTLILIPMGTFFGSPPWLPLMPVCDYRRWWPT